MRKRHYERVFWFEMRVPSVLVSFDIFVTNRPTFCAILRATGPFGCRLRRSGPDLRNLRANGPRSPRISQKLLKLSQKDLRNADRQPPVRRDVSSAVSLIFSSIFLEKISGNATTNVSFGSSCAFRLFWSPLAFL